MAAVGTGIWGISGLDPHSVDLRKQVEAAWLVASRQCAFGSRSALTISSPTRSMLHAIGKTLLPPIGALPTAAVVRVMSHCGLDTDRFSASVAKHRQRGEIVWCGRGT